MSQTAYFAFRGFLEQLKGDLTGITGVYGRLVLAKGPVQQTYWAQNIWYDVKTHKVESIAKAAKFLKNIQRSWYPYSYTSHRRVDLIQSKLPHIKKRRWDYLQPFPSSPLGSYTLLDNETLLYAQNCSESIPEGELEFNEDKQNPPSRAYLKLWEVFTRIEKRPNSGDYCLDLGACPGGWTWVIAQLGAQVAAIDRSPLAASLLENPLVEYLSADAFNVTPDKYNKVNWIFSDLICYPEKLYSFVTDWRSKTKNINYVCTIKFQGSDHYKWVEEFRKIPRSKIIHLYHNKHEFTWINLAED